MSKKSESDIRETNNLFRKRVEQLMTLPPEEQDRLFKEVSAFAEQLKATGQFLVGKISEDGGSTREFVTGVLIDGGMDKEQADAMVSALVHTKKLTEDEQGNLRAVS